MFMLAVVIVILVVLPAVLPPLPPPPMFLMGIPVVLMLMLIYLAISYPPLGSSTCASSSYDTNSTDVNGSVEVDEQWIYYIVNIKKTYYRLKSQAWTRLDSGPVHTSQSLLIVTFVNDGTFFGTRSKLAVRTCTFTRVSYLCYAYHVRADNNRE
ncbi:hypothetical protein YC2023_036627 [Brassica napus]